MPEGENRHDHERKPGNIEIDCLGSKWDQIIDRAVQIGVGRPVPVIKQKETDDIESISNDHEVHRIALIELFQFSHSCYSERK